MFKDFYEAWHYLEEHRIFQQETKITITEKDNKQFEKMFDEVISLKDLGLEEMVGEQIHYTSRFNDECLDIEVVKVNPRTNAIDDNKELNTKVQIWLEAGAYRKECRTHDWELDCGADSFEEAIIELANLVQKRYGDDPIKAMALVEEFYGKEE